MSLRTSAIRFVLISGLSFVVNLGVTIVLHEVCGAPEEMAFAIALITVFFMNFFAMRHYIYSGTKGSLGQQFVVYAGSALGFRGLEYVAFIVVHSWLGLDYRVTVIGIIATAAVIKFLYYRLVFERGMRTGHRTPR